MTREKTIERLSHALAAICEMWAAGFDLETIPADSLGTVRLNETRPSLDLAEALMDHLGLWDDETARNAVRRGVAMVAMGLRDVPSEDRIQAIEDDAEMRGTADGVWTNVVVRLAKARG